MFLNIYDVLGDSKNIVCIISPQKITLWLSVATNEYLLPSWEKFPLIDIIPFVNNPVESILEFITRSFST